MITYHIADLEFSDSSVEIALVSAPPLLLQMMAPPRTLPRRRRGQPRRRPAESPAPRQNALRSPASAPHSKTCLCPDPQVRRAARACSAPEDTRTWAPGTAGISDAGRAGLGRGAFSGHLRGRQPRPRAAPTPTPHLRRGQVGASPAQLRRWPRRSPDAAPRSPLAVPWR